MSPDRKPKVTPSISFIITKPIKSLSFTEDDSVPGSDGTTVI